MGSSRNVQEYYQIRKIKHTMPKLYFQKNDESCYPLQYHLDYMLENGLKEMTVFEAKRETGTSYFFCKEFSEIGEVGEGCGKICGKYKPLNGKNGRCVYYGFLYEQTEKEKVLKIGKTFEIKINQTIKIKRCNYYIYHHDSVDLLRLKKWINDKLKKHIKYVSIYHGYDKDNRLDSWLVVDKQSIEYRGKE